MGCYVRSDKNSMGCLIMSGVTKTTWDVLSGVANLCGMFCQYREITTANWGLATTNQSGVSKNAWDVLSWNVLSGSRSE